MLSGTFNFSWSYTIVSWEFRKKYKYELNYSSYNQLIENSFVLAIGFISYQSKSTGQHNKLMIYCKVSTRAVVSENNNI